ncbi:MAG: iron ABC transporter permease [Alphaproteobacteria bacterium]|nr:iron ABC transporter permease [Alphaproteobacteria bacterium]
MTAAVEGAPPHRRVHGRWGWAVAASVVAAFLALPALAVLAQVFTPAGEVWRHLIDTVLPDYIVNSLGLALMVAVGSFVIGVGTAWLSVMTRFPGKGWLTFALVLPLAAPAYVVAYAYADLLQAAGPLQTALRDATGWKVGGYWFPEIRSLGGAGLIFTLTLYPYVYLLARAAFLQQSAAALDVARTLGLGPWRVFFRVALPLARPAIAGGLALALMETLADFGAVSYLSVQTFTTGIYRAWYGMGERAAAGQLAAILLAFVLLLLALERIGRRGRVIHNTGNRTNPPHPARLSGVKALAATVACALPPLLGFVVPALALLRLMLDYEGAALNARFLSAAGTSLLLATRAALLPVTLAIVLAYARRAAPGLATRAASGIAGYGYALPGSVIAVGILLPMTAFDRLVNSFMLAEFGVRTGLLVTGTITGLLFAYAVRFIAPALEGVESGFERITPSIAAAARTLTRSPIDALARVHIPLIAPAALTAALIVFVDAMKELPATLLMRPLNSDTLAVLAYGYASDERLESAALPALTIVLIGLPPLILLMRRIGQGR